MNKQTSRALTRRGLTVGVPALIAAGIPAARAVTEDRVAMIERSRGGRLGVFVLDTGTGRTLAHRADERFLLASTFKGPLAAMMLSRVDAGRDDLENLVPYSARDLVAVSPVTSPRVSAGGMTVGDLCKAILERSDNTAANLLLARVGGPARLTAYVRGLGDMVTRFDRTEPVGGWSGTKDTTTPRAIAGLARTISLGEALKPGSRALCTRWMAATMTGRARLRAAFPAGWTAGDRTGTNDGVCNDYAVVRRSRGAALVMAAYYEAPGMELAVQEGVLREVGSAIVAWAARG